MPKMTVIFIENEEYGYGDLFLDNEDNIISFVSENDGNWRGEYFNHLFTSYGIKVECVDISKYGEDKIISKLSKYFGH